MGKLLRQDFYSLSTQEAAQRLLGKILCRKTKNGLYTGKIIETEAYLGEADLACHVSKGRTKRTEAMFGPAGHAYVYMIYGMYYCLNIVTQKKGTAEAVLIRALEPLMLEGEEINSEQKEWREKKIEKILNGPGKLCREFEIGRDLNGLKLSRKNGLWIEEGEEIPRRSVIAAPRVGVDYAKEWKDRLLRFYIKNNAFISKK